MSTIVSAAPKRLRKYIKQVRNFLRALSYRGTGRVCPVCGKASRRFRQAGLVPREDAQCPHCGAVERHRLLWLFISKRTNLLDGTPKKVLHIAPEECLEPLLSQALGDGYITADLSGRGVMIKMDVTDIQHPDHSFDVILCSHVLEHVSDDKKALREFSRVLSNSGWAILLVPITADKTYEDPSIVDPVERLKAFGQEDHVRRYGPDYIERLEEAGFSVEVAGVNDLAQSEEAVKMGLTAASGEIYFCRKQGGF